MAQNCENHGSTEWASRARQNAVHFDSHWREADLVLPDYCARDPRLGLFDTLDGARVLDIGSGVGEWAVTLALRGARVVACDVSLEGLHVTRKRAERYHVSDRVETVCGDVHCLPFRDVAFDAIHGQFILHHLDLGRAATVLARVLKPGGVGIFGENSANNPLLMFARRNLVGRYGISRWSVPGEYPLRRADIEQLRIAFGAAEVFYFEFQFFELLDGKIFGGRNVTRWLDPILFWLLPPLRPYGYTQLLRLRRHARPLHAGGDT